MNYEDFLKSKVKLAENQGFESVEISVNPRLKPHQKAIVEWMVRGGRRACFASFGLGKTLIQLEVMRIIGEQASGRSLIVAPLGVRQEFVRDAVEILGWKTGPKFIRRIEEAGETGIFLTNYETVRDGKLDPALFVAVSLDEASILRGFGGSKTFREFMRLCTGDGGPCGVSRKETVKYRFVATATPSPNDYIELLAYADFLGVMDISQAKTRFFKRDSTKADTLTLHAHKEEEFWLWVASWALFVQTPSNLGFPDEGYALPKMEVFWHEVPTNHLSANGGRNAGSEKSGQFKMFKDAAIGVQDAATEKRDSLIPRIEKMMQLREMNPSAHRLIWHDLEIERAAIADAIPGVVTVRGSDTDEHKEHAILGFSNGQFQELAGKPCMLGSGCNFQRHCSWAIFLGIGFKFNDLIQAIHRVYRFLQTSDVRIDLIFTEAEREVRKKLETKWNNHTKQLKKMTAIIEKFGLSKSAMALQLTRKLGIERVEISGERFRIVNNDNVPEAAALEENSVGLVVTSIPFANQYEYSPNYADFGHSEDVAQFFRQMDFLTPSLLRALKPGRVAAIHVKDRIIPGGMTGLGFQTLYPFHADCIAHYTKHGFAFLGMKTIVTDVVRENNQTYRLGWSEQCLDGSRMGCGVPEYLLLFRKPQTDKTIGRADDPVVKVKPPMVEKDGSHVPFEKTTSRRPIVVGSGGYSRTRWQLDAHGFMRSSGDKFLTPEQLRELPHDQIFQMWKKFSLDTVYDFEHHVRVGEIMEADGRLPTTFMLLQPPSWADDVWTDVTRMLTLNTKQAQKNQQHHLCPMQFDVADRCIEQFSMPGEVVLDPFGGLMTVPYRAILAKRFGVGFELNPAYFADGAGYCKAAEDEILMPSLFDFEGESSQKAEDGKLCNAPGESAARTEDAR